MRLPQVKSVRHVMVSTAMLVLLTPSLVNAQRFQVIHSFTGGSDGATPSVGLVFDGSGTFYGTAGWGGVLGQGINGVVFRLKPSGSNWLLTPIYSFAGGADGSHPDSLLRAADGTLYGTTDAGGLPGCVGDFGCGIFFHLVPSPTPPRTPLTPWTKNVLYRFTGGSQGGNPGGDFSFDQSGNVFGLLGGIVYELMPESGGWQETVLHTWQTHGPNGGIVFDQSGNLYGVTSEGGVNDDGSVYQLTRSGSGWTEQAIYSFMDGNDGSNPLGTPIVDADGNLYGTTYAHGGANGGTVFELTPANGGWTFNTLYALSCQQIFCGGTIGGKLLMDTAGNLYGTTWYNGANGCGSVFKLTHSNGGWSYTDLHDFTCDSGGGYPNGGLVFDNHGNIFGTAYAGGIGECYQGCGVVWELTP